MLFSVEYQLYGSRWTTDTNKAGSQAPDICFATNHTGCFFFTGTPPKSSKYKQVNLGWVRCISADLCQRRFT